MIPLRADPIRGNWAALLLAAGIMPLSAAEAGGTGPVTLTPEAVTPAPLYRDPAFDGAADPLLVWNPGRKAWWMLYTQRRAKLDLRGVAWCHGTEIGVAESRDEGMTWSYVGQLPLSHPDPGYSFWAPDVIRDKDGTWHLFVTYVPGDGDQPFRIKLSPP